MIKIVELINKRLLIGKLTILEEEPALIIENSYYITGDGIIEEYPMYAEENNTLINSANILTIYTPNEELTNLYLQKPQHVSILLEETEQEEDATAILDTLFSDEEQ